ncbi:MAG: orotidine-5'-phosphate decarboxylase [Candidatus Asgardarchaeia archaeon]
MVIGEAFIKKISETAEKNKSRVILALDISDLINSKRDKERVWTRAVSIAKAAKEHVAAIKVGYPLILATGLEIVKELKKETQLPIIGDFKIADIGNTNKWIAKHAHNAGIDALIAHAFIGEDAIKDIIDVIIEFDDGLFLLVDMSHPGATMFIKPHLHELTDLAVKLNVTGVIAPATRPEEIAIVRKRLPSKMLILSPGVGAQGGKPGQAIKNGADFEIIGRKIYTATNVYDTARSLAEATWRAYNERGT